MAVFKCKMCGASLDVTAGQSVVECEYCGSTQTLPKLDDDKRANLYGRADHFRRGNDYDKAMSIYEKILEEDTTDAEAYWSIVLCRFGIEYVEDPTTHKRIPTVNRMQSTSILADEDYKQALSYADGAQRAVYEAEANTIADIQKGILEISSKEKSYDVFICYKETDENGRRTQDSVLAQDLYYQLTQEGFKVFFSRITLEDKLGTAYEPYIFAALNSAKVMVAVGTKPQYFNAVWVKNEWSRYLALMKKDSKKMLVPAYKGMDPYDIPEELSHLQAQDMSKLGFMQDLVRGIKKILADDKPTATVVNTTIVNNASNANIEALLKRANLFLEDGDFGSAGEYADKILDINPEYAEAYLVKLLVDLHLKKKERLGDYLHSLIADNYTYQKILRFGDEKLKAEMLKYEETNREKVEGVVQHIDGITYERVRDLSGYICSSVDKSLVEANIQSTVLGLPVSGIIKETFSGCSSLTSITIPSGVTSIGDSAFYDCSSLCSVKFAENSKLTSIGDTAFDGCSALTSITIPSGVTSIGDSAFSRCSSLTSITIPSSVTSIGDSAFSRCSSLTSITIPSRVKSIGNRAFEYCSSLTSITIPSRVKSIGGYAFYGCRSLTSITIPSSVTDIGYGAFDDCGKIIIYSDTLSKPCGWDLKNKIVCSTSDDNVKDVQEIVKVQPKINKRRKILLAAIAISVVFALILVIVLNTAPLGDVTQDCIRYEKTYDGKGYSASGYCSDCISTDIVIQSKVRGLPVTQIGSLFASPITSITIPSSVTSIGEGAFYDCSSLTSITILGSVTSIGGNAFGYCSSLTSITIPESVTSIGDYAFGYCSSLTIYAEVASQPSGWDSDWNPHNRPVYWYSEKEPTGAPQTGTGYWHYDTDGVTPIIWEKKTL